LVSRIAAGARAKGATVEEVLLGDLVIKECDGCHACWGGNECGKNDDMRGMYSKIGESDVIIFGTPIYWYGPSGLMKLFIDRFVYFNCEEHRKKIRGKEAVIAIVLEEEHAETADLAVEFFQKSFEYLEMKLIETIIVPGVSDKGDILKKPQRLKEAEKIGRDLV
jgi:multimeric flavodoxin WrbA